MEKKEKKKLIVLAVVFVAVLVLLGAIYRIARPGGSAGNKSISLEVVLTDGASTTHKIKTDAEFLGAALRDEALIGGYESTYGYYVTTVDGITADESKQEWWCLTIGGELSMYGVDETAIEDGGHYEFTLKAGWDD